jgi:hypothetical protein
MLVKTWSWYLWCQKKQNCKAYEDLEKHHTIEYRVFKEYACEGGGHDSHEKLEIVI